jgi:hypothetical protein
VHFWQPAWPAAGNQSSKANEMQNRKCLFANAQRCTLYVACQNCVARSTAGHYRRQDCKTTSTARKLLLLLILLLLLCLFLLWLQFLCLLKKRRKGGLQADGPSCIDSINRLRATSNNQYFSNSIQEIMRWHGIWWKLQTWFSLVIDGLLVRNRCKQLESGNRFKRIVKTNKIYIDTKIVCD